MKELFNKVKSTVSLKSGNERSLKAKRNIIAMFFIKGISIAVNLALVPLTINYINPSSYGIWLTLSSIIAWISFFDIGFGNGLRNKFAEAKAKGKFKLAKVYVSTTYAVLSIIFLFLWLIFIIINNHINWSLVLNAPQAMANQLSILAMIIFSFFCLQMILKTINILIIASQKPATAAIFDTFGQLLALLVIYILTKTTHGSLINLGFALGSAPVVALLISTVWVYNTTFKKYRPKLSFVKLKFAKDIMGLGMKFFIIQIAAVIIYQTSNIIITQIINPQAVTIYNIAFRYFGIISMIFAIIISPFWSAFTDAFMKEEYEWMNMIVLRLKYVWVILALVTIIMLGFANYLYNLWIGPTLKIPINVSLAMAIYVLINAWNSIYSHLLNGIGKIKLQMYWVILNTLLNIPLALILGKKLGISGVILSSVLLSIGSAILTSKQLNLIIKKNASGIWNQ